MTKYCRILFNPYSGTKKRQLLGKIRYKTAGSCLFVVNFFWGVK